MTQSAKMSTVEIVCGTFIKFIWAVFLWHFIVGPLYGFPQEEWQSFSITFIFMVNGAVIAWLFRRWFNKYE